MFQERSHTAARGKAASGVSQGPTSWHDTTASTRGRNPSSASSASVVSPAPTTWPCTWSVTLRQGIYRHSPRPRPRHRRRSRHLSPFRPRSVHSCLQGYTQYTCTTIMCCTPQDRQSCHDCNVNITHTVFLFDRNLFYIQQKRIGCAIHHNIILVSIINNPSSDVKFLLIGLLRSAKQGIYCVGKTLQSMYVH